MICCQCAGCEYWPLIGVCLPTTCSRDPPTSDCAADASARRVRFSPSLGPPALQLLSKQPHFLLLARQLPPLYQDVNAEQPTQPRHWRQQPPTCLARYRRCRCGCAFSHFKYLLDAVLRFLCRVLDQPGLWQTSVSPLSTRSSHCQLYIAYSQTPRSGFQVLQIDERDEPTKAGRADGIQPRTIEVRGVGMSGLKYHKS